MGITSLAIYSYEVRSRHSRVAGSWRSATDDDCATPPIRAADPAAIMALKFRKHWELNVNQEWESEYVRFHEIEEMLDEAEKNKVSVYL